MAAGKFSSAKNQGVFVTAPGSGIMAQIEKQLQIDLSKVSLQELSEMFPKCLTEIFTLAKTAEITMIQDGATFKATGILYESLYKPEIKFKSVLLLGCPVVSSVAAALAKASGRTVVINEQTLTSGSCSVNVVFGFL